MWSLVFVKFHCGSKEARPRTQASYFTQARDFVFNVFVSSERWRMTDLTHVFIISQEHDDDDYVCGVGVRTVSLRSGNISTL
jgi:hypothetical protein